VNDFRLKAKASGAKASCRMKLGLICVIMTRPNSGGVFENARAVCEWCCEISPEIGMPFTQKGEGGILNPKNERSIKLSG